MLQELRCHEGDICDSGPGHSKVVSAHLRGADAVLFHVAGDTRFTPSDPGAQHHFNVFGSLNVVRLLRNFLASVVHVSTAYVAGNRQGLVLEGDLDQGQGFRNSYEPYLPYMNEACTFDLAHTRSMIPDYDLRFPPVTPDYLRKIIEFQRHQARNDPNAA